MKVKRSDSLHGSDRYVAGKPSHERVQTRAFTKPTVFRHTNSSTKQVSVVGTFNNWNPEANPMDQLEDGSWQAVIDVPRGNFEYYFLVDGVRVLDATRGTVSDGNGGKYNLLTTT